MIQISLRLDSDVSEARFAQRLDRRKDGLALGGQCLKGCDPLGVNRKKDRSALAIEGILKVGSLSRNERRRNGDKSRDAIDTFTDRAKIAVDSAQTAKWLREDFALGLEEENFALPSSDLREQLRIDPEAVRHVSRRLVDLDDGTTGVCAPARGGEDRGLEARRAESEGKVADRIVTYEAMDFRTNGIGTLFPDDRLRERIDLNLEAMQRLDDQGLGTSEEVRSFAVLQEASHRNGQGPGIREGGDRILLEHRSLHGGHSVRLQSQRRLLHI